jgi:hypothetical protein
VQWKGPAAWGYTLEWIDDASKASKLPGTPLALRPSSSRRPAAPSPARAAPPARHTANTGEGTCLIISDIDAGVGTWANVRNTVNTQVRPRSRGPEASTPCAAAAAARARKGLCTRPPGRGRPGCAAPRRQPGWPG